MASGIRSKSEGAARRRCALKKLSSSRLHGRSAPVTRDWSKRHTAVDASAVHCSGTKDFGELVCGRDLELVVAAFVWPLVSTPAQECGRVSEDRKSTRL